MSVAQMTRWVRRRVRGWSVRARVAACVAAALALCALLGGRTPAPASRLLADFPAHSPEHVAHFLADFTNHPRLHPHVTSGSWQLIEEESNGTWWRYVVRYECEGRCEGRAVVAAGERRGEGRGEGEHLIVVRDARCTRPLPLPWPTLCEETEVRSVVRARVGGGARLEEEARTACGRLVAPGARGALGALGALEALGPCGARARDLPRRRHLHLAALRHALAASDS